MNAYRRNTARTFRQWALMLCGACLMLLATPGCSAILDTDSLQEGSEPDGSAYDSATNIRALLRTPVRLVLAPQRGSLDFSWQPVPGRPNVFDLSVDRDSRPVFQVFSREGKPFARAGLVVVPLTAGIGHRLRWTTVDSGLHMTLSQRVASGEQHVASVLLAGSARSLSARIVPSALGRNRVTLVPKVAPLRHVLALR